jgi:hypothetical protein
MHIPTIQSVFLAFLISGCGVLGFESDPSEDSLKVELTLDKSVVAPGERFTATYTTTNRSDRTMRFVTSCTAFALIGGYTDGELIHLNGTSLGCYRALGNFEIGPKETLTLEWDIRAFTLSREIGQVGFDTIAVAPGEYSLRVHSNIAELNGKDFSVEPMDVDFRVQ